MITTARMPTFHHGDVEIAYLDEGAGEPLLLIHGFASNKEVNWVRPGWVDLLTRAGRRVIAHDNRGHGRSTKLYEPAAYHISLMADDACALLDHLGVDRADVMGYSMGARIAAFVALGHSHRIRSVILGGLGVHLVEGAGLRPDLAHAFEASSHDDLADPEARMFRAFAEQTGSDLRALAACIRGSRQRMTREQAAAIGIPMLVAVGTTDKIAGDPHELAAVIPDAEVLEIPNRDHMLAVGDRVFKQGVLDFLARRP